VQNEGSGKSSWWMLNPEAAKQPTNSQVNTLNNDDNKNKKTIWSVIIPYGIKKQLEKIFIC
jgi:hypothetical protein